MNPELQSELLRRFPRIFRDIDAPPEVSAMHRGFVCEDGWFPLIATLCTLLQQDTDEGLEPQIIASQVKEKFGSLRFRVRHASLRQRGMIALAEAFSETICEQCGSIRSGTICVRGCRDGSTTDRSEG